jgi:hypothetical protein
MARPRRCPVLAAVVLGSCLAALPALAGEQPVPVAAVLPAAGDPAPEIRRALTIELRRALAARGYRLAVQERVREVAAPLPGDRLPEPLELARIGGALAADLVLAPRLERGPDGGLTAAGLAVRSGAGALGPARVPLAAAGTAVPPEVLADAAGRLLRALLDGAGAAPAEAANGSAWDGEEARQPADLPRHDEGEWHAADHAGFFGELSFLLSWCDGDLLCRDTGTGFGGRARLGWRIASIVAVSATAAVAGHDVPSVTDLEELARTERVLVWYGFHGGVRVHPINRSWFDPFAGIDLGWTRLFYTEKVSSEAGGCQTSYMGIDLCDYSTVRNGLTIDGFSIAPQVGVNFFVTRNVALGVVAEFLIPFWSKACNELTATALGEGTTKGTSCVDIEDADRGFLELEHGTLDDEDGLPWHFNLGIHLAFVI